MLILSSGYRQVTIHVNKQEQFTPICGREPSEQLALTCEILAVFDERETRAESSSYLKSTNGSATHNSIGLIIKIVCLVVPLGVQHLVRRVSSRNVAVLSGSYLIVLCYTYCYIILLFVFIDGTKIRIKIKTAKQRAENFDAPFHNGTPIFLEKPLPFREKCVSLHPVY